jgi:hypothetical protein
MNVNPAAKAYMNLNIADDADEVVPKKSMMGSGLLSRNVKPKPMGTNSEPKDRVRDYVTSIRKARKQITNGG